MREEGTPLRVCIISSVHTALDNRVFYREARTLKCAGYEVTVAAVHPRQSDSRHGIRIVGLPKVSRWKRPVLWHRLWKVIHETRAEIIHFHDPELLLLGIVLRFTTGKRTIYDVHESYPEFIAVKDYMPAPVRRLLAWLFRYLEPALACFQSGLIFADDEIARSFSSIRKTKTTLFNFPSVELIKAGSTDGSGAGPSVETPTVIYLGGLERNRGSHLMIEAFSRLRRQCTNVRLLLVGHFMPPSLKDEFLEHARERNLEESITIIGRVPFEEIGHYLRESTIGWVTWQAVPKNCKNIPTKLFEYMAYGLPIVSSDLPSTSPFVKSGKNGFLVRANDPEAHATALAKLLADTTLAANMGRDGRRRVESDYNWTAMEVRLLRLYTTLVG